MQHAQHQENLDKILVVAKDILSEEVNEKSNYLRRATQPKFSGIEVMALNPKAEFLSIDSVNDEKVK